MLPHHWILFEELLWSSKKKRNVTVSGQEEEEECDCIWPRRRRGIRLYLAKGGGPCSTSRCQERKSWRDDLVTLTREVQALTRGFQALTRWFRLWNSVRNTSLFKFFFLYLGLLCSINELVGDRLSFFYNQANAGRVSTAPTCRRKRGHLTPLYL